MQSELLALCQLRIQRASKSWATGGEVTTVACGLALDCYLLQQLLYILRTIHFRTKKQNEKKKTTHRKANLIMSEKRMNLRYCIPHKSKKNKTGK